MKSTKTKGKPLSIIPCSCDCPALLFCFHFVLTYIHPLRLSALCMPVQHGRGPPGEQTHTAGYAAAEQSPSPFPFPLILPPPFPPQHCLCAPPVYLMTWTLIRLEAPWCPAPGASTSPSSKVIHAVSHMSWLIKTSCPRK